MATHFQEFGKTMKTPIPFIVASATRSGTHLLNGLLTSTGYVGNVIEVLEYHTPQEYHENARKMDRWGMQIHARAFHFLQHFCEGAKIGFKDIEKWVWLVRKDKIAQALSKIRARETRLWALHPDDKDGAERNELPVEFDMERLYTEVALLFFEDQLWETFFEKHDIKPFKLYYEDLVNHKAKMIAGVLAYLDVDYTYPLHMKAPTLKQAHKDKPEQYHRAVERVLSEEGMSPTYLRFEREK